VRPYYQDDLVTLYHGDCLRVLPTLATVDHIITDPPYGVDVYSRMRNPDSGAGDDRRYGRRRFAIKGGDSLSAMKAGAIGSLADLVEPCAREFARLCERWCLVFSDVESCHEWRGALTAAGLRYIRTGAWVKPDAMPQMTGDRPAVGFEPCTIAAGPKRLRWNGGGRQALWTHNIVKGSLRPHHPCPKPEALMIDLIGAFTDPDLETILDPFAGSGTTLYAAKRLGRKAIGIEIEERYCAVAAERLSQGTLWT
jgi:DNA modification methylase